MTEKINNYHVYVTLDCPYCNRAVKLLEEKKEKFIVTVLDNDREKLTQLKEQFSWQTVPMVVGTTEEGKDLFLGGCSDLEKHFELLKG